MKEWGKEDRKEGMCEWGYWTQMIDDVVAHVTMCVGEGKRSWGEVRWTKMRKVKSTWVEKNVRKWSNSLILLLIFVLCSRYSKTTCGHKCFQWLSCYSPVTPRVVHPPENFANTDDSEVVVNEQSPVNHPPTSTTRSLSYPPPRPPQPLPKYSFDCSLLFPTFHNPSLNCTALLPSLSSTLTYHFY